MKSNKIIARTYGVFFLLAFLSYGIGTGITGAATKTSNSLLNTAEDTSQFIIGIILMALIHTIVNIGLPVLMTPILKPFSKVLSIGYLSAGITATVILIVGSILLLLHIPLSTMHNHTDSADLLHFETIGALLTKGNFYAYQLGMTIWGIGGLMFCYLLYVSRLVPHGLSIWGFLGYLIFISGTVSELFGYQIGVPLSIPGGFFEITLSFWLLVKGFNASALK